MHILPQIIFSNGKKIKAYLCFVHIQFLTLLLSLFLQKNKINMIFNPSQKIPVSDLIVAVATWAVQTLKKENSNSMISKTGNWRLLMM